MPNNQILRVALYPRVSTEEQAAHGYSLDLQEEALVRYANEHGYKIVGIYRDEGNSARKPVMKRKVMLQLLEDVKAGKIDRILFLKLDRWFRNVREYHIVQEVLEAHNVTWQAIMEEYDTVTANGRLRVNIMLSVAENESDRTSERIKFVFDGKRQRKEWCFPGGPDKWPYGYMPEVVDGVKRCVKNPETAPIVQDFWDYVVAYGSVRKAGMYVDEKYGITRHYRTWMCTARHEIYTGSYKGVEGYCEPYVSKEDWERIIVNHEIVKKTQRPERVYLFTGLIRCPCCGNTLKATFKTYPNDRSVEYKSYRCNNARLRTCDYRYTPPERYIEKYLLENIRTELERYATEAEVQARETRRASRVTDVVTLNEKLRRLNVIYMAGNISDEEYSSQTRQLKTAIEKAKVDMEDDSTVDVEAIREFLATDFETIYKSMSRMDQQRFWRSLIKEIKMEDKKITGIIPRF